MQKDNIVWANGEFLELEAVPLIPFYRGLQFGDGLFETIRADHGKIHFLPEHLSRLTISCQALNIPTPDFSNYEKTIGRLLELNRLHTKTARIKILLSRGFSGQIGLPKTKETACLITASRYSSPTAEDMAKGINLISYSSDFPIIWQIINHSTTSLIWWPGNMQILWVMMKQY